MSPWILVDSRSPNRVQANIQDEFNREGSIFDQGQKKLVFFIPQRAYKEQAVGWSE